MARVVDRGNATMLKKNPHARALAQECRHSPGYGCKMVIKMKMKVKVSKNKNDVAECRQKAAGEECQRIKGYTRQGGT